MDKTPRVIMKTREAEERVKNFSEVNLGYNAEEAAIEASRCLECKNAPCKQGCPVNVQIPEFIKCIKQGETDKACAVLKQQNSLPAICGRVCPQERQCEKYCVRARVDASVAIGNLERYLGDYSLGEPLKTEGKKTGKKVAVVGSGPAGLSCAAQLIKNGIDVTVFEAFHNSGGVLKYGIPEFRLPKTLVDAEISALKAAGVEFKLNTVVGKTLSLESLRGEFDAVFIGSGAGLPVFMGIEGESLCGVYSANEYLTRINLMKAGRGGVTPILTGQNVLVAGAGNVAMDAARTAKRMGSRVTVIYRRSRKEMPARAEEIAHAEEEGIEFMLLANPVRLVGENGRVRAAECVRMELSEPDAGGRARPVVIPDSSFTVPCDIFITALGTSPNPLIKNSCPELAVSDKGTIIVDDSLMTSVDGVYAGGDAVTGAATVIAAFGMGKQAAQNMIKRFKG